MDKLAKQQLTSVNTNIVSDSERFSQPRLLTIALSDTKFR